MNKPTKMLAHGGRNGHAKNQIPPARAQRAGHVQYDARGVGQMPEIVSIVTGNHTASSNCVQAAENIAEGETTIASGIHAVAGIGPTTFSGSMPQ